jgi:hypothetical protein
MPQIANSQKYIEQNFPELLSYKKSTSRMYEKGDKPGYQDSWWFKFLEDDLDANEFMVFAGAFDYNNKEFKIFKVPSNYIKSNINKVYRNSNGWIILYVHFTELIDLRYESNLPFKGFELN